MKTVDVCIPVYKPQNEFMMLMERLCVQTVKPSRIIIANTCRQFWDDKYLLIAERAGIPVSLFHLEKDEFDHGATRNAMAKMCGSDMCLFMTMDAYPKDRKLIENMLKAFSLDSVGACYARQIPKPGCGELERQTRRFNYPKKPVLKTKESLSTMGVKTYFCSNVCAMYRRSVFLQLGMFPQKTIFNEDMIFAAKLINAGYGIMYEADARVFHSHNYSAAAYFSRSFDMAVSQAMHPEVFSGVSSEKEGMRMVRVVCARLVKNGRYTKLVAFFADCAAKYLGYFLGRRYERLPGKIMVLCSDNKSFWKK